MYKWHGRAAKGHILRRQQRAALLLGPLRLALAEAPATGLEVEVLRGFQVAFRAPSPEEEGPEKAPHEGQ